MMTIMIHDSAGVVTILKRHQSDEGICRCCGQPWPCDVRVLSGLLIPRSE